MRPWLPLLAVALPGMALAAPAGKTPGPDEKELAEMVKDLERFAEAVKDYRTTARGVIRRTYAERQKEIKAKYDGSIGVSEKEERDRRKDAITLFEAFLAKYPHDRRYTPDAMFRLGELYYEKAADDNLTAVEAYQKALDSPTPPTGPAPLPDFARTIALYKTLLTEFPSYRMLDRTYYILGYCQTEMLKPAEARQAFLALTCSNRYRALDTPAPVPPSTAGTGKTPLEDTYKDCVPVQKDSKFLAEAWTRVGEIHFDAVPTESAAAISAFNRVLEFKESGYYDRGLYKLAWSYYRDNRFLDAVKYFDALVKWSDQRKLSGEKPESDLRPESILYLGISFAEEDWDGDTVADPETGLQRAETFYRGREQEPHVREIFKILGDIYFDRTKFPEGIAVYKTLLVKWPMNPDAPKVQQQIVRAYERDRNMIQAARERELLGRNYTKGSEWYKKNRDNAEAIAVAQELAENALVVAATNVHSQAIACRETWRQNPKDAAKLVECKGLYKVAGELYEKYLAAYPNSKNTYEYSWHYAEALNYSDQLPAAITAYTNVRDSVLDNKYQEESARQIIKAYEAIIDKMKAERRLTEPSLPDEKNTRPPVVAMTMPEIYQKYMAELDWYVANIKSDKTPDMKYQTAILALEYRMWPEARKRLTEVTQLFCGSKPEVGFKAYDALIKTYFIDYLVQDEEQKDCALGRLMTIAEEFTESPCGKSPQAGPYLTRFNQIRSSVKTDIITKRVVLAQENEEKGTNRELTMCREGPGGIAIVTGVATASSTGGGTGSGKPPASKLSTELDEGLALDLIDVVNNDPKAPDAPTALNNACVIYEKLYMRGSATKCYERLYREYPASPLGTEALWNASKNHFQFFQFEDATRGFLTIAQDPKFAASPHRKEALGTAANLLDNDQQYGKAAELYRRYADAMSDKPAESAQAYFFSCRAYEKQKDVGAQQKCLNDFHRRYGKDPAAGDYVVEGYMKKAIIAEQGRDKNATLGAYKKVRDEFVARRLAAATPAAGFAAKADFLIIEERFKDFQDKRLSFSNPKKIKSIYEGFVADAKTLADDYKKIWDYKDATWTLASMLRMGDVYYEFAQKLVKAADEPPDDIKSLERKNCKLNPDDCGMVLQSYKDEVFQMVTPIEDQAKQQWKATLQRASALGVTNDYVKKARENLSKYLPEEFPFIKDERIHLEIPQ